MFLPDKYMLRIIATLLFTLIFTSQPANNPPRQPEYGWTIFFGAGFRSPNPPLEGLVLWWQLRWLDNQETTKLCPLGTKTRHQLAVPQMTVSDISMGTNKCLLKTRETPWVLSHVIRSARNCWYYGTPVYPGYWNITNYYKSLQTPHQRCRHVTGRDTEPDTVLTTSH